MSDEVERNEFSVAWSDTERLMQTLPKHNRSIMGVTPVPEKKPPHEVYISKPEEEGLKFLTRMDTHGVHNLLLIDTNLSPREVDKFISDLMRLGCRCDTKCKDLGFILIIINKGWQR